MVQYGNSVAKIFLVRLLSVVQDINKDIPSKNIFVWFTDQEI
jgi:hypothetical protein